MKQEISLDVSTRRFVNDKVADMEKDLRIHNIIGILNLMNQGCNDKCGWTSDGWNNYLKELGSRYGIEPK